MVAGSDATLNSLGITRGGGGEDPSSTLGKGGHRSSSMPSLHDRGKGQKRPNTIAGNILPPVRNEIPPTPDLSFIPPPEAEDVAEDEVAGADDPWNSNKLSGLQKDLQKHVTRIISISFLSTFTSSIYLVIYVYKKYPSSPPPSLSLSLSLSLSAWSENPA